MLQKGFLKPRDDTRKTKNNVKYLVPCGAVLFIIGAVTVVLQGEISYLFLSFIIVGSVMVSASLWIDVFAKNRKSKIRS